MLNIGDKVKLIDINLRKEIAFEEQEGVLERIYKDFILIDLENYKTCLNKADLIEGEGFKLQVRQGNEWLDIGKEIFKDTKLLDGQKDRNIYRSYKKRDKERR